MNIDESAESPFSRRRFLRALAGVVFAGMASPFLDGCGGGESAGKEGASGGTETAQETVYKGDSFYFSVDSYNVVMSHANLPGNFLYISPEFQVVGDTWRSYLHYPPQHTLALTGDDGLYHATRVVSANTIIDFAPDSSDERVMHVTASCYNGLDTTSYDTWTSIRFGRNFSGREYACPDFPLDIFYNSHVDEGGGVMKKALDHYPYPDEIAKFRFVLPHVDAPANVEGYRNLGGEAGEWWKVATERFAGQSVYCDGYGDYGYGLVWEEGAARSLGFQNFNHWLTICAPHLDIWYGDIGPGQTVTRRAAFIFSNSGFDGFVERRDRWLGGELSPMQVDWSASRTVNPDMSRLASRRSFLCGGV